MNASASATATLPTVSRTAGILAEMKAADAAHAGSLAERAERHAAWLVKRKAGAVASGIWQAEKGAERTGRKLTLSERAELSLGVRGADMENRNANRRDAALPRRIKSMVSRHTGRTETGELNLSVFGFFTDSGLSEAELLERALLATLPEKIAHKDGSALLAGLAERRGFTFDPADKGDAAAFKALMRSVNPGSGRAGGRPRKVAERFSAGVYIDGTLTSYLRQADTDCDGIPTSEAGIAAGAGHDQGAGYGEAAAAGKLLSSAQSVRMNVALDASSHGYRTLADGTVAERW